MEYKPVSFSLFDPTTSIFVCKGNAKANYSAIFCCKEKCPFRDNGTCISATITVFGIRCPYSKVFREEGYTKRARKYNSWINKYKEKYAGVPRLSPPAKKLAFVGDYVYLPYAHLESCRDDLDLKNKLIGAVSACILHKDDWNIENVLKIIRHQPKSWLMGQIIPDYQNKQIPLFLLHLRDADPKMWDQVICEMPHLDKAPNHVGRKALLKTLDHPIEWTTSKSYPVKWKWDGKYLITNSLNAYSKTWCDVKLESLELKAIPKDNTEVEVKSNDWVTSETVFTN